jgi:hypothetical protein
MDRDEGYRPGLCFPDYCLLTSIWLCDTIRAIGSGKNN